MRTPLMLLAEASHDPLTVHGCIAQARSVRMSLDLDPKGVLSSESNHGSN